MAKPLLGILCILLATIGYGVAPPFTAAAITHGSTALDATFARTASITAVFAIAIIFIRPTLSLPVENRGHFILQVIGTALVSICYLASVTFIPVSLAVIIFFTFPVWIAIISPIIEGEPINPKRFIITLIAFTGLAIVIGPNLNNLDVRGLILAALAALGAVLQNFSGRNLSAANINPLVFGFWAHLILCPLALILALWFDGGNISFISGIGITGFGYVLMGILCVSYISGYFMHMTSLKFASPSIVAPFFNLEPVISISLSVLVFGEIMTADQYKGGALVLAALIANAFITGRKQQTPT